MKQFLKFAGFVALGLALIGFILMMATPAIKFHGNTLAEGTDAIFGKKVAGYDVFKPSVLALFAWIFVLLSMLFLMVNAVLVLVKKDIFAKHAKIIFIVLAILLILAGVFMFLVIPTFISTNGGGSADGTSIGVGWIIGAILLIGAGAVCCMKALVKE